MTSQQHELATESCLAEDQSGIEGKHDALLPEQALASQERLESIESPQLGDIIDEYRQARGASRVRRSPSSIDVIVIHTPEGGEAGTLSVLNTDRAGFDFYLPLNGKLYQCNDYLNFYSWQAGHLATNQRGVGIEQGDFARNSGEFPHEHYDRLARLVAALVDSTGTPLRRVTRPGEPGIIAHADVTPAQRTDPGARFLWDKLFELVRVHLEAPGPTTIAPQGDRTIEQLEAENPNIRQQLVEWRQMRLGNGADPNDYPVFRQHLQDIGAPDPGAEEFVGFRARTLDEIEAENPNIRQQLVEWRQMRLGNGADPGDYAVFRQHVQDIGAPDPGAAEFIGFR